MSDPGPTGARVRGRVSIKTIGGVPKGLSFRAIVYPLGQPNKAIGRESQIESWLPPLAFRLLGCAKRAESLHASLSLSADYFRTVLAVKVSLRRAYRRALDGSGPFRTTHPDKREREGLKTPGPQRNASVCTGAGCQVTARRQLGGGKFLLTSPFIERLERGKKTAGNSVRASGMVAAANRTSRAHPARDHWGIPQSRRNPGTVARRVGAYGAKTGQRGDYRPHTGKTGQ